ncbi:MAG: SDR family oxidoreductase [Spirochaetales bacterium]|nr:SDR family oxidoreductase [Spirochaetales bacterium]
MKMTLYEDIKGKTAVVTGGAAGIGRAAVLAFADNGVNVAIADVQEDKAKETLLLMEGKPGAGYFIKTDVSSDYDVRQMIEETINRFGCVDYAFNNAGIEGGQGKIAEYGEEEWNRVISINLKGVWLSMKYEIRHMLERGKGAIVNTSSVAGKVGFTGLAPYVASKHGINGLTKTAALDYAANGLRINAVCPGVIRTEMIDRVTGGDPEKEKAFIGLEPIGRMGRPDEIASAVLWLCSDSSSFVTGHCLVADGGFIVK